MTRVPFCLYCRHYSGGGPFGCAAFPDRIPLEIRTNERSHRVPYPGDGGIRFEPDEDAPAIIDQVWPPQPDTIGS